MPGRHAHVHKQTLRNLETNLVRADEDDHAQEKCQVGILLVSSSKPIVKDLGKRQKQRFSVCCFEIHAGGNAEQGHIDEKQ